MKLRLGDLKRQGDQFVKDTNYLAAMRAYVAVLRRVPEDYETRLALADCLAGVGATEVAVRVYEATAELSVKGGRPLVAVVACRALVAQGGSCGSVMTRLSVLYGRGSNRLASVGARLNVCADEIVIDTKELRRELTVAQLVEEAVRIGVDLDAVGELPLKFSAIPLLSELSPVTLLSAVRATTVKRLPAGQAVIRQGEQGKSCYLVARGKVQVMSETKNGEQLKLASLTDGAIFGEMALVSGMPRSASVVTVEETDLVELGPEAFAAMGEEINRVAESLDRLAKRRWMSNVVQQNPVFQVFSDQERQDLLARFEAMKVPRGTILIEQGERARGLYIVARGQVANVRRAPDTAPKIVDRAGPGAMPGLETILDNTPARTSTVTIAPVTTVLFLPGRFFRRLAAAVPEVLQSLQASVVMPPPAVTAAREISHSQVG
jgi:CRP-like cAMP-binding protein